MIIISKNSEIRKFFEKYFWYIPDKEQKEPKINEWDKISIDKLQLNKDN